MRKPYIVCGGLQDNGSWCGPSATRSQNGILNSDWYRVGGGDGFYTANDPTDWTHPLFGVAGRRDQPLDLRAGGTRSASARAGPQAAARRQPAGRAEGVDPEQVPRCRRSSAAAAATPNGNIVPPPPAGHQLPLLLEHAVHALAAQPVDDLSRRRSAVPVDTTAATRGWRRPT